MKERFKKAISIVDNMSDHKMLLCVFAIFFIAVNIRSLNALSIKVIVRYWDELLYYDYAKSFLHTGLFSVRGAAFKFSSVGYSFAILPVMFMFQDSAYVVSAICIWNAIMICSSVFPIFFLTKKIIKRKSLQMLTLILAMSLPIFSICLNVLAESLFFPLSFWTFLLIYICFDDESRILWKQLGISVIIGALLVLLYITKTLGGVVLLAYGTTAVWRIITRDLVGRQKELLFKDVLSLVSSAFSFILFYFLSMRGIGLICLEDEKNYAKAAGSVFSNSLTHLTCMKEVGYFLYAIIMPLGIAVIAMALFPVILPLCDRANLSKSTNTYTVFSELLLVWNSIIVAYTIIIVETPFNLAPVHHYRYCEHLAVNFLILSAAVIESWIDGKDGQEQEFKRRLIIWVGLICIVILTTFRFCNNGVRLENYGLEKFYKVDNLFPGAENMFDISTSTLAFRVAVVFAALITMYLFTMKRSRWIAVVLTLTVILVYNWNTNKLFNNIYVGIINNNPSIYLDDEMVQVDDYLETLEGNVLIVKDQEFSADSTVFDTFIFTTPYQTSLEQLSLASGNDSVVNLRAEPIYTTSFDGNTPYTKLHTVDYILSEMPDLLDSNGANLIPLKGIKNLYLYRLKDNTRICLNDDAQDN